MCGDHGIEHRRIRRRVVFVLNIVFPPSILRRVVPSSHIEPNS
jgi:hypothetical protein